MRLFAAVLSIFALLLTQAPAHAEGPAISRISFGSCARQDQPQPIWDAVVETKPELFIFLGDNIYADTEDMKVMKAKYQLLGKQPGYQKLKKTCPILATWDDHDYGANDAGAEYPKKKESQQLFLEFFEVPKDDIRWTREGVYHAQMFGPPGKRVQVILLDGRYFRSPLKTGFKPGEPGEGRRGRYVPNMDPDATLLGKAQWDWLEEQLKQPADLRIIGSGIQVIADEHGSETWGNFPLERKRLLQLIRDTKANGVVFISGDRHLAEISRLAADHADGVGYPLYDVTSSSLNVPSGNFTKAGTRFANEINSYRVGLTYFDTNFGAIHIDWNQPDPVVRLQVRDEKGGVVLQRRVKLSELQMKNEECGSEEAECAIQDEKDEFSAVWKQTRTLPAPEAHQAAAADEKFVYAITNTKVAKYDRETGQRVAVSTGPAKHLNSGFFWKGKLYCAHSNYPKTPEESDIKVLDTDSMELSIFKDFGNFGGSLTWSIYHDDHWWCNFAHYGKDNAKTFLVQFDDKWNEKGRWTYPSELIRQLGRYSLSGGIWRDGHLLVTGHDDPILFRLRLPKTGTVLEYVDKQSAPFTGQGIADDPKTGGLVGINRAKRLLVFASLEGRTSEDACATTPARKNLAIEARSASEGGKLHPFAGASGFNDGNLSCGDNTADGKPLRLRVLSYNIHHGRGMDDKLDLKRIARVILSVKPDIVSLQEVDKNVRRTQQVDQPAELAKLTGMHIVFGGNIKFEGGDYGNAILSRFPIVRHENHKLPNFDDGEQRGVLAAEIKLPSLDSPLLFLATHLDHRKNDRERIASAQAINKLATKQPHRPALLAGDLNDVPKSATMMEFAKQWTVTNEKPMPTIPVVKPTRQIDYILYRPADRWQVIETQVLDERVASDHRPILAVVELRGKP